MTQNNEWTTDELPNGLRVVTVPAPHLHSAVVVAYVRAGSRHETADTNGVTHFLEHILFRGCRKYPNGRQMNARAEDAGGSLNAATARDHGYYFTPIHPSRLEVAIDTLGAMLAEPLYRDVDIEREIILEEMLDEVDEKGRDIDVDNINKRVVFGDHPLGFKIAGTPETVRAMTREKLEAHHARFYGARNMVLTVAGPVARQQVVDYAHKHFGSIVAGEPAVDLPPPAWPEGPGLVCVTHDESQTDLRLSFPSVPEHHPDFPALIVLRRVLDDGLSTRLQTNIVEKRGLAYSVGGGLEPFSDTGFFDFDVSCAHQKVPDTFDELLRTIGEIASEPVPEEELERARRRHRMSLEFALDSASDLAAWFGGTELFRPPETFEERARQVDAVTADDVLRVARSTFRKNRLLTCAVGLLDKRARKAFEKAAADVAHLPR